MKYQLSPMAIDTQMVEMSMELGRIRRLRNAMVKAEQTGAKLDDAVAKGVALEGALNGLDGLYNAYRWSRYYLVPGGHVHSSQECSTCNRDTILSFMPNYSGCTEQQMISEFGDLMCTVCFPDAPVDPAYQEAVRKTEAEKQAARDERAAKAQAAKDATPKGDDGEPLKVGLDTPKTLLGARNAMTRRFKDIYWYLETHKHNGTQPSADSVAADMETLAECNVIARSIARMTGETAADVYEASRIKAEKSAKAEFAKALRDQAKRK